MTRVRPAFALLAATVLALSMVTWLVPAAQATVTSRPPDGPWGRSELVDPQAGYWTEISCPDRRTCWIVDSYGNVVREHGTTFDPPERVLTPGKSSISCAGDSCVVVGSRNHVVRLVDGEWQRLTAPDKSAFHLVSCGSATSCMALGQHGGRALDGETWAPRRAFDPQHVLTNLSCPTSDMCMAGDRSGGLFRFDGENWTPTMGAGLTNVLAISCASATFCVALGTNQEVATYDGATWTPGKTRQFATDVSCVSETFCVVVGGSYASFYDGRSWSEPEQVVDGTSLYDVSCVSATACRALIYGDDVMRYDGSSWQRADGDGETRGNFVSVSCPSPRFCGLVDGGGNWVSYQRGTWSGITNVDSTGIEALDCRSASFCAMGDYLGRVQTYDGTTWTAPQDVGLDFVNGLSCVSTAFCFAVGNGTVSHWNGATWSPAEPVDPGYFFTALSCVSVSFCLAIDEGHNLTRSTTWDGADWSAPVTIVNDQIEAYNLDCLSPTSCMAATTYSSYAMFDGSTWSGWNSIPGYLFNTRLSCTAPTFCVATGVRSRSLWDGVTWSRAVQIDFVHPPHGGAAQDVGLTGVSCASETFCVAADARGRVLMTDRP